MNYISLFCGCGGSSLGYKRSGMNGLLGIDSNPISCESYGLNFPNAEVWNRDIKESITKRNTIQFWDV